MPLASDATFADIKSLIGHPSTYFPPLIAKLTECAEVHGSAYVRIGIDGTGYCPYYLITVDEKGAHIIGAYDYGNPFTLAPDRQHWSTKPMGLHEVIGVANSFL